MQTKHLSGLMPGAKKSSLMKGTNENKNIPKILFIFDGFSGL
jgi:hypothetical protein